MGVYIEFDEKNDSLVLTTENGHLTSVGTTNMIYINAEVLGKLIDYAYLYPEELKKN